MINVSYLKSQMYVETIQRIDSLRSELHSIILGRQTEYSLRWQTKLEQIYFDLSLYDLSFSKKHVAASVQLLKPPTNERDVLIYRWKEAINYINYNCFYQLEMISEDTLYDIYRIIHPKVRYLPFQELPEYIRYAMSEDHPVTRAALIQCFIYNLKPYPQYNEPFSHLGFQLAMVASGWDLRGIVGIEEQYFHDRAYYKILIQNTFTSGNVTQWIEYVADRFMKQLEYIISSHSIKQTSEIKTDHFVLNERQKRILMILEDPKASVSNKEVQKITNISQMTAVRDLAKLVDIGLIRAHGKGRGVRYTRK